MEKNVILGFNNIDDFQLAKPYLEEKGYNTIYADNLEELEKYLKTFPRIVGCIMDLNLGFPESIEPIQGVEIYKKLEYRVEKRRINFIGISPNEGIIKQATKKGIPKKNLKLKDFGLYREFSSYL